MTRFFYERNLVMKQLAQRELIAARADEIAATFTPQRAGKLIANIQRNPTLPADVHLAAVDAPDPVRDRLEGSLASVFSGATMVGQAQTQNRSTRDVLERATSSPTGMVGDALNAARTVAKPAVRSVMPTLDFAPQAAQAASRTLYSGSQDPRQSLERYAEGGPQQGFRNLFADVAEQTDLGQQVVSAAQGDNPFDMGTGWFLSEQSDIFQRRQQAERSPGGRYGTGFLPNGEVYTAGRGLASMVGHVTGWDTFTADSEGQHAGYKILSGLTDATTAVAIPGFDRGLDRLADAGRAAYRAAGGAVDAERFLRDVGGMRGAATQIDLGQARQFLQSSPGRAMVDWLTSTNSVEEIWRRTNGKLDPELMTRLADETNPQRVMDAIWDGLQRGDVVEMSTRASAWRRGLTQNLRWTGEVPAARLDLNDGQSAVRWADDFATHTLVGSETRTRWIDTMARATDIGARRSAYHAMLGDVAANLMSSGHTEETARMLTRYADDLTETFRIQADEMASSGMMDWGRLRMLDPSGVLVDDRLPGAFMLSERATSLPVPDLRELKRGTGAFDSYFFTLDDSSAMNRLTNVFNKPQGDVARVLFDVLGGFQRFWKDAALMRLAYPIRVVAEEQVRMASAGYNSMFRHPLSYFSHMLTSNTRSMNGQLLSLDEVYREALSGRSLSGMREAGGGGIEHMVRLQRGASDPAEFARAWADEIETLRVDPVASRVARSTTIDEAVDWLLGRPATAPSSRVSIPTPEPTYPGGMSRAEFEASGQRLYHGADRRFDTFEVSNREMFQKGGVWRGDGFYFTDNPQFANTFAERNVAVGYLDSEEFSFLWDVESRADQVDLLRAALAPKFEGEMASGTWLRRYDEDWQISYEYVSKLDDFPFDEFLDASLEIVAMPATRKVSPVVHMPEVFGRTIDLRSVDAMPEDLFEILKKEGTIQAVDYRSYLYNGRPLSWEQHERSAGLVRWLRENGFGSAQLVDDGADSFLVLPEFVKFGKNDPVESLGELTRIDLNNPPSGLRVNMPREAGDGAQYLQELRNMHPDSAWDENFVREYVTSLSRRIHETTNGNPTLLEHIRGARRDPFGRLADLDVSQHIDDAPTHVTTTQLAPTGQGGTMARMGDLYDRSTGRIFEVLGAAPTNKFSRSPVFLQAYTDKLIELAPLSNSRNFDRAAELTGLFPGRRGRDVLSQLRSVSGNGRLTIGQIDELARRAALDEVQGLLYDLSRKGQFFDTYRLIFPFGEAWKEVVSTWSRLVKEDPFLLGRRAGQGSQAAGESIAHDGDSGDQGWFFVNENDETVFVYPGSEQLTGLLTGVPVEMTAGVSSLNMVGEVMPGVGPVGQYPASMFIPDNPRYDGIRNAIMPFGEPGDLRSITTYLPAWLRRIATTDGGMTPEEIRLFGNTKWRTAQYLYSTGDYDLSSPAGQAELLDDAHAATQKLWAVRGAVQFGAPAAPKLNPQVIGENGELVDFYVMYDRYRALVEADSETALEVFLNEFGADALLVPQGNTVSVAVGGVPLNGTAALDWVRENPEIRDAHPQLYGFFAPSDGSTEFNHDAYQRALDNGEIIPLTDEQKIRLANNRYGADQYNRARTALVTAMAANGQTSPTQEQTRIMSDLRARLERDYNGYNRVDDIGGRPDATTLIDQGDIERALADPLLRDTEVGQALSEYWEAHETVRQAAAILEIGNTADSWRTANDGAHLRSALRAIGEDLSARYPAFAPMWDDFLVDEFLDIADEKPQEGD